MCYVPVVAEEEALPKRPCHDVRPELRRKSAARGRESARARPNDWGGHLAGHARKDVEDDMRDALSKSVADAGKRELLGSESAPSADNCSEERPGIRSGANLPYEVNVCNQDVQAYDLHVCIVGVGKQKVCNCDPEVSQRHLRVRLCDVRPLEERSGR